MSELYRNIRANKGAVILGPSLHQQHQNAAAIANSLLQAVSHRGGDEGTNETTLVFRFNVIDVSVLVAGEP